MPFDLSDFSINGVRYQHIITKITTDINNYSNESTNYLQYYVNNINKFIYMDYNHILAILSTLILCFIASIHILEWKKKLKIKNKIDNTSATNANNDEESINEESINKIQQPKELYFQSILEVLSKNEEIITKMKDNDDYWVLLRVVMKNPLVMKRSKYELHGNNVGNSRNKVFKTQDMFMIIRIKYYNSVVNKNNNKNNHNKFNMANTIIRSMNYLNNISNEEYNTKDFVVVAIGNTNNNTNPVEFYNGLINNNYELFNYRDVIIKVDENQNINLGFILMLPIHKVYDIFMDVYNNTLFESKKYEMDDNNYESWNGKSINEITF